MINNEHNPIAVRISNIQDLWLLNRAEHPDAKVYILDCSPTDFQLVEGFIRLEASEYGNSSDIIIGFMVDYTSPQDFYRAILDSWVSSFASDIEKNPQWDWKEFDAIRHEFSLCPSENTEQLKTLLLRTILSFKKFIGDDNFLGITLFVSRVSDVEGLNESILDLSKNLPYGAGFILPEYKTRLIYEDLAHQLKKQVCIIQIPDQQLSQAYKEIATQGNPQDPHIKYRKCLFDLGQAAANGEKDNTIRQGQKLLQISREIGSDILTASSYLVFSGFLIRFSKEIDRCLELLDAGIKIVQPQCDTRLEATQILLQLYNYKGTVFSYHKKYSEAIEEFSKAIVLAKRFGLQVETVNEYNFILLVALKKGRAAYMSILEEAFEYSYSLTDEILQTVNISYIVSSYLEKGYNIPANRQREIISRMESLYGDDWSLSAKELASKLETEYSIE